MCIAALAPACPVVAPAGMIYFIVVIPMLRWLLVFVYRPRFDGGGDKWPYLHDMVISSLILGQVRAIMFCSLLSTSRHASKNVFLFLFLSVLGTSDYNHVATASLFFGYLCRCCHHPHLRFQPNDKEQVPPSLSRCGASPNQSFGRLGYLKAYIQSHERRVSAMVSGLPQG